MTDAASGYLEYCKASIVCASELVCLNRMCECYAGYYYNSEFQLCLDTANQSYSTSQYANRRVTLLPQNITLGAGAAPFGELFAENNMVCI